MRAELFVFAIQTCEIPAEYNALDVGQWQFYVARADAVRGNGARSVGLPFLEKHARVPLARAKLRQAVPAAGPR